MKRQFIVMGMFLLMSGTTAWAQSTQTRESETTRAAAEKTRAVIKVAQAQLSAREAELQNPGLQAPEKAQAAIKVAQAQLSAKVAELQKRTLQTPVTPRPPAPIITNPVIDLGQNFGQNQLRIYTNSRSADPLS